MNNTFNLQRFLWLFSKHTKEHYKAYLISTVVLTGMLAFLMLYFAYIGFLGSGPQAGIFYTILLFGGSIFTSIIFADLHHKRKSVSILTLPVSHFERFLVGWIYSFVISQIIFVACFYAVDFAVLSLFHSSGGTRYKMVNIISKECGERVILVVFWILHAIMLVGSLFFKKLHFVKSALVILALLMLCIAGNNLLVHFILGANFHAVLPFSDVWFSYNDGHPFYLDISENNYTEMIFAAFVVSSCIWIAAFFKMKEKQA